MQVPPSPGLPESLLGIPLLLPLPFPARDRWLLARGFRPAAVSRLDPLAPAAVLRVGAEFDAERLSTSNASRGVTELAGGGWEVLGELDPSEGEEPWRSLALEAAAIPARPGEASSFRFGSKPLEWRLGDPLVMGILNVTPDSFSDGGDRLDPGAAAAAADRMLAAGAAILDVGAESTRPGSVEIPESEEIARLRPALERIRRENPTAVISVDTRRAGPAQLAAELGADVLNDVSGLADGPALAEIAARHGLSLILGHMRGTPATMQQNPVYDEVVIDVAEQLAARVARAVRAGVPRERILVDPGLGFGKSLDHNLALVRGLPAFRSLAAGVVLGASRKGFLGALTGRNVPKERLAASLGAAVAAADRGAAVVRVHDAAETCDLFAVRRALSV